MEEPPRFRVTPAATTFVKNRGGSLYIWCDSASLVHAKTAEPKQRLDWTTYQAEEINVWIDASADIACDWKIGTSGFPWKRITVWSNLNTNGGGSGAGFSGPIF